MNPETLVDDAYGRALHDAVVRQARTIASVFLHPGCDLACRFCASETGFDTMSPAHARAVFADLRDAGVRNVVMGGGEPATWPFDLFELCADAQALGHFVQVSSNGTALSPGFASDPRVDRYVLPLESADPRVHDAQRRAPGGASHHALVLERLEALVASGKEVTISTVVTRTTAAGVAALSVLLDAFQRRGLALHAWQVYRFVAIGRGGRDAAGALAIDGPTWRRALAAARSGLRGAPVYARGDIMRSRSVFYLWRESGRVRICAS